ncbi:MAG: ABC transporter substrate-binding protein [Planctomycetota bacterium]
MPNKFGLKDFITILLLLAVAVSVWLGMVQSDRRWSKLQDTELRQDELGAQLGQINQRLDAIANDLESGIVVTGNANGMSSTPAATASWARPGVEIVGTGAWDFTTDPTTQAGYTEGGVFTEIFEGQPSKITPYLYADVYGRRVVDFVCESLGWYDPIELTMRGRLAEAWQYDPDGYWLRVKIRDRARFSNGDPVTAEDVRWTYDDFLFNEQIEAERFRSVYNAIDRIDVISDKVVEFHFLEPRFDNLQQAFGFKILPKNVYEPWLESPATFNQSTGLIVGSGPFRLDRVDADNQWTPPNDIMLVRNEQYWGPKTPLAGYRYTTIADSLTRLTAYENNTGDMMRPTGEQFIAKRDDPDFRENSLARQWYNMRGGYSFIAWQCGPRNGERLTPFADKRVRQAMTMLIDRDRLRREISKNLARPATGPFLSSTPQANPEIDPWPYDVDRGLALLNEAGWSDTDADGILENERGDEFRFEITFGAGSASTLQFCEFLRAELAKVGVVMELRPIDWSVLQDKLNRRDFDAITFAWSASAPENDPNQIWHSNSIENQGDNFIQWASEDADRLIELGRATLDVDERMKVWHELHAVFHEEQPYTFLSELPWMRFTRQRVQNMQEYPSGLEPYEYWISAETLPVRP